MQMFGNPDLKVFTKVDFLEYAAQEQAVVFAVKGLVCRLDRTTFEHPGGDQVIQDLHARDATEHIEIAHRTDKHVYARLRAACVGKLVDKDCLVPQIDKDLRRLKNDCEEEGLFDLSNAEGFIRIIEPLVVSFVAVVCLQVLQLGWIPFVFVSLLGMLGYLRLLWWMHDVGHHAVFPDGRTSQTALDLTAIIFFGCYLRQGFREHSIHHAFTNTLDHDWNAEFLHIFEVAPEHAGRYPKLLGGNGIGQWVLWYGLALPMFGITKIINSLREAHTRGWWWRPLSMVGRMAIVVKFGAVWSMFVLPQVALYVLAFLAVLNHLQMPMVKSASSQKFLKKGDLPKAEESNDASKKQFDPRYTWGPGDDETTGNIENDEIRRSFTYAMVAPTCSVAPGSNLYGYLSGGLNYHIEHHLFPCMAPPNLSKTADRVHALLDKYGLPYATESLAGAVSTTAMQLLDPSRVAESPTPKKNSEGQARSAKVKRKSAKETADASVEWVVMGGCE